MFFPLCIISVISFWCWWCSPSLIMGDIFSRSNYQTQADRQICNEWERVRVLKVLLLNCFLFLVVLLFCFYVFCVRFSTVFWLSVNFFLLILSLFFFRSVSQLLRWCLFRMWYVHRKINQNLNKSSFAVLFNGRIFVSVRVCLSVRNVKNTLKVKSINP